MEKYKKYKNGENCELIENWITRKLDNLMVVNIFADKNFHGDVDRVSEFADH